MIFNDKFKENDGKIKDLIYRIYVETAVYATLERLYDERETGEIIAWDKEDLIAFERSTQSRKMKE